MKVGIVTWFYGSNYGAKAQSYGLQKIIEDLGYEAIMIDFRTKGYKTLNIKMNFNYPNTILHPIRGYYCLKRNNKLAEAIKLYNLSDSVNTSVDINSMNLDVIVFGSDAIFNVKHPLFNDIYMGVGIKTKKIAYSPSCEYLDPNYKLSYRQIESLMEFECISVRDNNTKLLLENNCNINSKITVDPTLLYDFPEIDAEWIYRDYLLVYSFSDWNKYGKELRKFAKRIGKKILSIGRFCDWADTNIEVASFEQWIASFKYAEYVFTDSFHGTVFAIKNKKELILVSREDKKAKINSLLNDVGMKKQFYTGGDIEGYLERYFTNYDKVTNRLLMIKNSSLEYLKEALKRTESKL